MSEEEKRIALGLEELTRLIRGCALDAEEDGMPEVAEALYAVAELPEEERAKGIAVLVRFGKEFAMMRDRAAVTAAQQKGRWN